MQGGGKVGGQSPNIPLKDALLVTRRPPLGLQLFEGLLPPNNAMG